MKGRVEVIKNGVESRFSWKPDPAGTQWNQESLRSLLAAADVRVEVAPPVLEEALSFFNSNQKPAVTGVIARGVEPQASVPLRVEFNLLELPPEAAAAIDEIIRGLPPAEGEVRYGWARQNTPAGTVTLPVTSRPGLALNREPIPPPEPEGEDFRIGGNLEIRGGSLIALAEGLLRFGPGRADLVSCPLHLWSLDGGFEQGECLLNYRPGSPALPLPQAGDIAAAAGRMGYLPDRVLPEQEIRSIIAGAFSDGREVCGYPISKDTDGKVLIRIDPMRLRADLHLRRETGRGRALSLGEIAEEIRDSGLKGLDGPAVKTAIMKFWIGGEKTAVIPLKEGRGPERGPDRELEFLIPFLEEQEAAPVRQRLETEPHRVMGIASLREFPASSVSRIGIVTAGGTIGRLGTPAAGRAGKDIDGREIPGIPGNDPDIRVHEGLNWDGNSLIAVSDGLLDVGRTADGLTRLRVRPHRDAEIRITVSDDRLKAFISTRLPIGTGAPVTPERIRAVAEGAGVVKGLSGEALQEAAERSLTGEIIAGFTIAEGRLPMEGNSRLSLSVSGDPAKAPVPVQTGEVIGVIREGDAGGWNVLGEPLMDEGGFLREGENIRREENGDGTSILVAERGGHLVMSEGRLLVKHLLDYVGNISMASGNVRFPGRIRIEGSVLSRVVVDGGEGVEISEVVQAALVNSGGDVTIGKGIKGEGKAVVRCLGRLRLGYAEDANLLSSGDIQVKRTLMNCRVKCNGRLEFTGSEGKIVGGVMKLKDGLVCSEVGNERGTDTVISFGQDYLVENQIDTAQKEHKKIQEYLGKVDELMGEQERKNSSAGLILLRGKKVDAMKMLEKKTKLLFLLREKFELHFNSEVRITGTAWPGVTFESHGRLLKVEAPLRSVSITFNPEKGRLERKPLL